MELFKSKKIIISSALFVNNITHYLLLIYRLNMSRPYLITYYFISTKVPVFQRFLAVRRAPPPPALLTKRCNSSGLEVLDTASSKVTIPLFT